MGGRGFDSPSPLQDQKRLTCMENKEFESMLTDRARAFVQRHKDLTPEQLYCEGFKDGMGYNPAGAKVNYEWVMDSYNRLCRSFSRVQALSSKRKEKIRTRLGEMSSLGDPMSVLELVLVKMEGSAFLKGDNQRGWKATFDWLFENGNNWVKVYEGQYDDRQGKGDTKSVNGFWDK